MDKDAAHRTTAQALHRHALAEVGSEWCSAPPLSRKIGEMNRQPSNMQANMQANMPANMQANKQANKQTHSLSIPPCRRLLAMTDGKGWPDTLPIPLLAEMDEGAEKDEWVGAVRRGVVEWQARRRGAWPRFFRGAEYREMPLVELSLALGERGEDVGCEGHADSGGREVWGQCLTPILDQKSWEQIPGAAMSIGAFLGIG